MASESQHDVADFRWTWISLLDDLPYAVIIVLGLIGISWTSIARSPTATYWVYLTPVIGLISIVAGWRHTRSGERIAMVVTQVLQWAAVLIAMVLITTTNARKSLEANATGLMLLTVLALRRIRVGPQLAVLETVRDWRLSGARRACGRLGRAGRLAAAAHRGRADRTNDPLLVAPRAIAPPGLTAAARPQVAIATSKLAPRHAPVRGSRQVKTTRWPAVMPSVPISATNSPSPVSLVLALSCELQSSRV